MPIAEISSILKNARCGDFYVPEPSKPDLSASRSLASRLAPVLCVFSQGLRHTGHVSRITHGPLCPPRLLQDAVRVGMVFSDAVPTATTLCLSILGLCLCARTSVWSAGAD